MLAYILLAFRAARMIVSLQVSLVQRITVTGPATELLALAFINRVMVYSSLSKSQFSLDLPEKAGLVCPRIGCL